MRLSFEFHEFAVELEETQAAWAEESIVTAESEGAVGAYDRVPFKSANAVFSAEIKKGVFSLHSAEAVPVDGGKLRGSGKISIKPDALYDPLDDL